MKNLIDILLYFAKFPDREGVLSNFQKSEEKVSGYTDLRAQIEALPDPLMPQIKDFIYTSDETKLQNRMRSVSDYFLLVEFGQVMQTGENKTGVKELEWLFTITLAKPENSRKFDSFEEALISNESLLLIREFIRTIETDDKSRCKASRILDKPYSISPLEPYMLYNSVGWVLTFRKTATNLNF